MAHWDGPGYLHRVLGPFLTQLPASPTVKEAAN